MIIRTYRRVQYTVGTIGWRPDILEIRASGPISLADRTTISDILAQISVSSQYYVTAFLKIRRVILCKQRQVSIIMIKFSISVL